MVFMADPEWLDDEEMRIWRGFVEVSGRVKQLLDLALKLDSDMTFDDYEVLVHLSEAAEQRLRMTDLSERLLHSQGRLTQRIDRLVGRGWVARQKCPDDGRVTHAVITKKGMAAAVAAAPGHLADVRALLIDLIEPAERATVVDVFERIAAGARESTRHGKRTGS